MYRGWVKIHRKIWDNPIVTKDSDYIAVWIYLLTNASHKNHDIFWRGERITLHPGELVTGRKEIAKATKVNETKVYRILKTLKSEHQIEQQPTRQGSLFAIVNWNEYQNSEQQSEQQVNNNRTTTEQQVNTIQECKELKIMINHDKNNKAVTDDEYWTNLSPEARERWDRIIAKNEKYMEEVRKAYE